MELSTNERRHEIDWLRVIAFGTLVFFHSAVLFIPEGFPSILNQESSPVLGVFTSFLHQFRLSLLFLVAGIGVQFSMKRKTGSAYLKERSQRLLIPLFFGVVVIVPPMIYFEKLYNGGFIGSFWEFYPKFYTEGVYPVGNLSWHHFWFVAYLYIMCVFSWPLFQYLLRSNNAFLKHVTGSLSSKFGLYKLILLLIIIEVLLRPAFPGIRDLLNDWASFIHWWIIFVVGFLFACNVTLLDRCKELRRLSLVIAILTSGILYFIFYDINAYQFRFGHQQNLERSAEFLFFSMLKMSSVWAWILTIVGFSVRYLNYSSNLLKYLNGATFPLYCLHLTITVMIAFYIVPTNLSIPTKFFTITIGTFVVVFVLYELLVKRVAWLKPFVGAK